MIISDLRQFSVMDPNAKEQRAVLPSDFPVNLDLDTKVTPLNIPILLGWLDMYESTFPSKKEHIDILRDGFTKGFVLFSDDSIKPFTFKNHFSARAMPHEVN